jgi:hypothetical protein
MAENVNEIRTRIYNLIENCNNFDELQFAARYLPSIGGHPPELPANRVLTTAIVDAMWEIEDIDENAWDIVFPRVINRIHNRLHELRLNQKINLQKGGKVIKNNPWISHVKSFAVKHKISLKDAMKNEKCKSSYKKL